MVFPHKKKNRKMTIKGLDVILSNLDTYFFIKYSLKKRLICQFAVECTGVIRFSCLITNEKVNLIYGVLHITNEDLRPYIL